jgi:hypothetical protein
MTTPTVTREFAVYEYYQDGTRAVEAPSADVAVAIARECNAHLAGPGEHRVIRVEAVTRTVDGDGTVGAWMPIGEES